MYDAMLVMGGLLGSAHCVGMCGGFVLALGSEPRGVANNALRQLTYAIGRIWVYVVAGGVAGFLGWRLGVETRSLVTVQAALSIFAGALLLLEAAFSLGWLRRPFVGTGGCSLASFGSLLRAPNLGAVFAAGVWNGFLPCGLVYAYLALAASASGLAGGAWVMLLFGVGTAPALFLVGMTGSLLALRWRERLFRAAAWCLLVTGAWTLYRGAHFFAVPPGEPPCPFCAE